VGSWLFARAAGGRWLVRMENLDTPRVVPGAADGILRTLGSFGLEWDGEIVFQSERIALYEAAFEDLLGRKEIFACACSRTDLLRAASAPASEEEDSSNARREAANAGAGGAAPQSAIYPGTCRNGLPPGRAARAFRFRVPPGLFTFEDLLFGSISENLEASIGDFVVKRADGPFAYQLAVVVDDAAQGVTDVVRGADLLDSTARQIHIQRLLGAATPRYLHVPVATNAAGEKLSKQTQAPDAGPEDIAQALEFLGMQVPSGMAGKELLEWAIRQWDASRVPRGRALILSSEGRSP
jgi:glutamyl-Q tRNA(Asp) synthetase